MTGGELVFMMVLCLVCYFGGRRHGAQAVRNSLRKEIDR